MVPPVQGPSTHQGGAGSTKPATVFGVNRRDACTRGLVAEDGRVQASLGAAPPDWSCIERYVALPTAARAQVLGPRGAPAAGAAALRAFANGAPWQGRIAASVAGAAVRAGLAGRVGGGVTVAVSPGTTAGELPDLVLSHHLARVLGRPDVDMAVRVGGTRPNSKPVMRVSAGAEALAYAKVGWSPLTRELVAAEAEALRRLASAPPASFSVPELLHAGEWRGTALTVVAPVGGGRIDAHPEPPAEATTELARGAGAHRSRLDDGAWWQRLRERIGRTGAGPQRALAERTAAAHGGTELDHGRFHGDWTPWNMTRTDGRLLAWDWERAGDRAPVGIDAVHHCLLVLMNARGLAPEQAAAETLARAGALLAPLGVAADAAPALVAAELLEMSVRFAEAADAGVTGLDDRFGRALSALLDGGYHGDGRA